MIIVEVQRNTLVKLVLLYLGGLVFHFFFNIYKHCMHIFQMMSFNSRSGGHVCFRFKRLQSITIW